MSSNPADPTPEEIRHREAAADVTRKLERISAISRLVLLGGIVLVLSVIAYRLWFAPSTPQALEQGAVEALGRVVSAVATDSHLTVTFDTAQGTVIVIYDLRTLREIRRVTVGGPRVPRP